MYYVPGGGSTGVVGRCGGVAEVMGGCIVGCADCRSIRMSPSLLFGPIAAAAAAAVGGWRGGGARVGGARDTEVGPDTLGPPGGTREGFV